MGACTRRELIAALAKMGAATAAGIPVSAAAAPPPPAATAGANGAHAGDWAWLAGNWDVRHRRLKERLVGDTRWEDFAGKGALWLAMGGLGTIDDNLLELPGDPYRGLTLRAFDPAAGQWSIWWLDARRPTMIDPPVRGGFDGDAGTFLGRDTFKGRPIVMRFRWNDIHGARPWWEQAFSADDGRTWETNWRNWFTRTAAQATPLARLAGAPRDFDFLAGRWNVRHRRLRQRLVGSTAWDEFGGTLANWPVLGGQGNVGDNFMALPAGEVRGIGLRAFDPKTAQWSSWWLDSRAPASIGPPLRGAFADGVGTFVGDDVLDGRPVTTRVVWSGITPRSARWEQACSADGGVHWETNWTSEFTRVG